jgi:hypothetical protein
MPEVSGFRKRAHPLVSAGIERRRRIFGHIFKVVTIDPGLRS